MDLVKEFDIDVDLLIDKTQKLKVKNEELRIEIAGLEVGSVGYLEKQKELEEGRFVFDTYVKYLWVHLKDFKPKSEALDDVLAYQQKILEVYILTSENDTTELQKRIDLAKKEYEKETDKEKAGFKLLETLTSISVENAESELKKIMD